MKKKIFIAIDVLLILLSVTPIGLVLYDCIDKAINGVGPWGDGYGLHYHGLIYGYEAFRYELRFDLFWGGAVFGIPWACLILTTIIFTVFTVMYAKNNK
jgi:hypothetical protein